MMANAHQYSGTENVWLDSEDDQEIKLVSWKLGYGFARDLGTVSRVEW